MDGIREFFRSRIAPEAAGPDERAEHALRLAAAALLFEIARADGEVKPEELTVMKAAVQGTFGLAGDETRELMELAEEHSRGAASLYELTLVVDEALPAEQKKRIVELLWLVAFADSNKDAHEEHLVRKVAGLLHVPHPDFIDAKISARRKAASG